MLPVHPHMRGEYGDKQKKKGGARGSSPHAWRISRHQRIVSLWKRFIPTCVENMAANLIAVHGWTVHPHMRGEYVGRTHSKWLTVRFIPTCVENILHFEYRSATPSGSSPHAWRIFHRQDAALVEPRFIPTCVENMTSTSAPSLATAVHPHMRGEYVVGSFHRLTPSGSSPHAWRICSGGSTGGAINGSSPHAWRISLE